MDGYGNAIVDGSTASPYGYSRIPTQEETARFTAGVTSGELEAARNQLELIRSEQEALSSAQRGGNPEAR